MEAETAEEDVAVGTADSGQDAARRLGVENGLLDEVLAVALTLVVRVNRQELQVTMAWVLFVEDGLPGGEHHARVSLEAVVGYRRLDVLSVCLCVYQVLVSQVL